MRTKLTQECPVCGRGYKASATAKRIRCACGTVKYEDTLIEGTKVDLPHWLKLARRAKCDSCDQFGNKRCALIEFGCRRTYIHTLEDPKGECPLGLWKDLTKQEKRPMIQAAECTLERRSATSLKCSKCSRVIFTEAPIDSVHTACRHQPPEIEPLETNLIYHVCALKSNDHWIENISQLVRRWRVFTQRKVVAVAVGPEMFGIDRVRLHFPDDTEFLEVKNCKRLREVKTFGPLLEAIKTTDYSVTFYAHTKGNSTADDEYGAKLWRNAMYHYLLDHWRSCLDLLQTHPCVGTTKMVWGKESRSPFPTGLIVGNWMFAGTFFWFRNDLVFGRDDWNVIADDRYGAEAYLSGLFGHREAASVFQPWPVDKWPIGSPYDPNNYFQFAKAFE